MASEAKICREVTKHVQHLIKTNQFGEVYKGILKDQMYYWNTVKAIIMKKMGQHDNTNNSPFETDKRTRKLLMEATKRPTTSSEKLQ